MQQLGVALIGCGMVAHVHISALKEIKEAKICGVCECNPEVLQNFSNQYKIHAYQSYEKLLEDPEVNTVIITLPPSLHVEYGLKAAEAGKNIILEKPFDINVEKAHDLINICHRYKKRLAVIFQNRFTTAAQKIKDALNKKLLGRLILGDAYVKWYRTPEYYKSRSWRGTWSMEGGGALINQAIHIIDLIQWFMGGIKSITGIIKTAIHKIETEDLGVAIVEYTNGAIGIIEGSTAIYPGLKERIEIHGEKGSIIYEGGNIKEWKVDGCKEKDYIDEEKITYGETNSPVITQVNHKTQLQEIIRAFLKNKDPLVNGEEGLKSLRIVCSIYESSQKRERIFL